MPTLTYRLMALLRFWAAAQTIHRVHSPLAFDWASAVLNDDRHYYAFDDIEALRHQIRTSPLSLEVDDYGAHPSPVRRRVPLRQLATRASSTALQGRWLFRTAQWARPERVLELGTCIGIGTAYLAAGAGSRAQVLSLEGCNACAQVARVHLEMLNLSEQVCIRSGPFVQTLPQALTTLGRLDLAFFDGHHRSTATLQYWEACLPYAHEKSIFIFDDVHHSADMTAAWRQIQSHPRVRLTIDCFELAFVFFDPAVRQRQHLRLVPTRYKPWQRFG